MIPYRLLALNTSATLAGRLASIALGVVLATVLFRALGAEQYGMWSLLTLITGYSTLIDFGLSSAVERRVAALAAAGSSGVPQTVGTAFALILLLGVAAQLALMLWLAWPGAAPVDRELRRALLLVPFCTAISLAGLAAGAALAGQQRFGRLHLWRTVGLAVGTAAVVAAVAAGVRSLASLLLFYTSGSVVMLALIWHSAPASMPRLHRNGGFARDALRDLVAYGSVVQAATMTPPIAEYLFRLVVGTRLGFEYAGVYDLAARAAIVPRSLAGSMFTTMVPFAVHIEQQSGDAGLAQLLRTTVRHVALFVLPVTAVLLAFAAPLMQLWLGASDPAMVHRVRRLFELVLLAHAVGAVAVPAAMIARALGRVRAEAIATIGGFAAALVAAGLAQSFELAGALLWLFPAAGGYAVWAWLAGTRRLGFVHAGDSVRALAAAGVTLAVARTLAAPERPGPVLARLALAVLVGCIVAAVAEFARPDRRRTAGSGDATLSG